MYLVDNTTLQLEEFTEGQVPPYATLSHRWTSEEISFKDVSKDRARKDSRGYQKLLGACHVSKRYDVNYLWMDTCCINRKSSAELSEAINSMYSWYSSASVCIVYLEDVDCGTSIDEPLAKSVWFTRAWTLQELLAPPSLDFFDAHWCHIGSRDDKADIISTVTHIPRSILVQEKTAHSCTIAERMLWAANRHATRTEDLAYSLMGLFDVNIPLLYGEGAKAFIRLQEEIIRCSIDLSVLAWNSGNKESPLLANSPAQFDDLLDYPNYRPFKLDNSSYLTNIGLNTELELVRWRLDIYAVPLGRYSNNRRKHRLLLLRRCSSWSHVLRIGIIEEEVTLESLWLEKRTLTIRRHLSGYEPMTYSMLKTEFPKNGFAISTDEVLKVSPVGSDAHLLWAKFHPKDDPYELCKFDTATQHCVARLQVDCLQVVDLWVKAYFDFDSRPCVSIHRSEQALHLSSTQPPFPSTSTPQAPHPPTPSQSQHNHPEQQTPDPPRQTPSTRPSSTLTATQNAAYYCCVPDTKIWVRLDPPRISYIGTADYWGLGFSLKKPSLGTHLELRSLG